MKGRPAALSSARLATGGGPPDLARDAKKDALVSRFRSTDKYIATRELEVAVNAAAPFWFAQAAIPHLIESRGNIVNVLSQSALIGTSYIVPYSMSKAAALQLTKSLSVEYAGQPIRINAVAPGSMMTEISEATRPPADADFALIRRYSGQRPPADVAEVAAVAAFLASDAASAVHGAVWTADGGVTAG